MPATDPQHLRADLARAILPHVPFEGWSKASFEAAVADCGADPARARAACPRGAVDLAATVHRMGDAEMTRRMAEKGAGAMRYSERVADALWIRLDASGDKEAVRRATALFALPHLAIEGSGLIWGTADAIWSALGDTSRDGNWYSKRAILSAVYGSTVLYWLGDTGPGGAATRAFIDRRIGDVMRFEKFKADARASKVLGPFAERLGRLTASIHAPRDDYRADLPGTLTTKG